jgi:hypothetical protein
MSSPKSIEKMLKRSMIDEVELKGAKDDAIVESAEIVLYDMLIQFAQKALVVVGGDAIPLFFWHVYTGLLRVRIV